jgi:transcriptional regulator with PAS, ATPase and Fis domain
MVDLLSIKQRFGIIGNSDLVNRALEIALRVAPTDLTVLITGESGVGKEFFPQVIHSASARKHGKYVAVNCGAIPEGTIDSELFGHEKGAFTGAVDSRKGYFEEADGGTIFLDEVGELPLSTQVRLLRVLQTGEFIRVGSARVQKTNVRVVAATNNNLLRAISEGRFREDLYYRLATVPITVPALRERPEDIYLLFRKFASDVAVRYHMPAITLDASARDMLERYSWPGNVRQLKNVAEQISAIESERVITAPILERYLTAEHRVSAPSVAGAASFDDMNTERELLYKILFDMRADINEMKQMLYRMGGYGTIQPITPEPRQEVAALLPNPVSHQVEYAEEIIDESPQPATKADMQREQIVRALRRNGGSRRAAAAELFMSERTLYRRIKELGIEE